MPGFSRSETLVKTAVVNQLYGTNLYGVVRMSQHISRIMRHHPPAAGPRLVEKIACIPPVQGGSSVRHFSFASKFCNRFVDSEACPIMDAFAVWTVGLHLGDDCSSDPQHPYRAFVANTRRLLKDCDLTATSVELDAYLWIRGAYAAWQKNPAKMNLELKGLFGDKTHRRDLARVMGDS